MVNQWHQRQVWHRPRFRLLLCGGSHSGEECSGLVACFACSSVRKMADVRHNHCRENIKSDFTGLSIIFHREVYIE
jgi:hypothetical protein